MQIFIKMCRNYRLKVKFLKNKNIKYYDTIILPGLYILSKGLFVKTSLSSLVLSSDNFSSFSISLINFFFKSTFFIHGGVHNRWSSGPSVEKPVLGLEPRLEGGVDALHGIGRGGVLITSSTDSSVASLAAVVDVVVIAGVVLVRDMVTVVVITCFLLGC